MGNTETKKMFSDQIHSIVYDKKSWGMGDILEREEVSWDCNDCEKVFREQKHITETKNHWIVYKKPPSTPIDYSEHRVTFTHRYTKEYFDRTNGKNYSSTTNEPLDNYCW